MRKYNEDVPLLSDFSNIPTGESSPFLGTVQDAFPEMKVYHKRWWMLFVFSLTAFVAGLFAVIWTVLANTENTVYGWGNDDIAMTSAATSGGYLLTAFPVMYLIETRGMQLDNCKGIAEGSENFNEFASMTSNA